MPQDFFGAHSVLKVSDREYAVYRLERLEKDGLTRLDRLCSLCVLSRCTVAWCRSFRPSQIRIPLQMLLDFGKRQVFLFFENSDRSEPV